MAGEGLESGSPGPLEGTFVSSTSGSLRLGTKIFVVTDVLKMVKFPRLYGEYFYKKEKVGNRTDVVPEVTDGPEERRFPLTPQTSPCLHAPYESLL